MSNPFAWSPGPQPEKRFKDGYEILCVYRGIEIIAPIGWDQRERSPVVQAIYDDLQRGGPKKKRKTR